jgi:hypothetical protein
MYDIPSCVLLRLNFQEIYCMPITRTALAVVPFTFLVFALVMRKDGSKVISISNSFQGRKFYYV